jgi:translation initiation factor 1
MADEAKPFHNPFAALAPLRAGLPDPPAPTAPKKEDAPASHARIPRAVVRLERTGRGGKEVTVVEHLNLHPRERESWLKALKSGLGCGGVVEGEALVLQGDHRDRVPKLLMARGVKKVTVG